MFEKEAEEKTYRFYKIFSVVVAFVMSLIALQNFGGALVFSLFLAPFIYFPCVIVLYTPVHAFYKHKLEKEYKQQQAENYAIDQANRQREQYNQSQFELEQHRQKLQIEFEHYAKIALLNAHNDQQKILMLQQMEREFEQTKKDDLASLNAQIQRMKGL